MFLCDAFRKVLSRQDLVTVTDCRIPRAVFVYLVAVAFVSLEKRPLIKGMGVLLRGVTSSGATSSSR